MRYTRKSLTLQAQPAAEASGPVRASRGPRRRCHGHPPVCPSWSYCRQRRKKTTTPSTSPCLFLACPEEHGLSRRAHGVCSLGAVPPPHHQRASGRGSEV